jgi:hypothetical protein
MKYCIVMGSGVMTCTPSFIKIGSGVQNLLRFWFHRQHGGLINLFSFFQNKENRLIIVIMTRISRQDS